MGLPQNETYHTCSHLKIILRFSKMWETVSPQNNHPGIEQPVHTISTMELIPVPHK